MEENTYLSSLTDSNHASDFSIGSVELYGGTPVTNDSYDILELQSQWIETEICVIEQMKGMFIQKIEELTNYHLNLLGLDQSLSRLFLLSVYNFDETLAKSYHQALWANSIFDPLQQLAQPEIKGVFFSTTLELLNGLSQMAVDETNLKSLLETNRKLNFSPCSIDEMRVYYKKMHKERREKHLRAKTGNVDNGAIPTIIEFEVEDFP